MNIKADLWFPTVVWNYQLKEVNDAELRDYVINFRQDDPGKRVSNYGGQQSRNIDILDERPLNIEKFIVALQQNVNDAAKMANLPKLQICDYWWNINNKGDYNHPHNHRDSILSGVYYIDVPEENMGDIHFEREDDAQYFLPRFMPGRNQITALRASYKPKTGNGLIFPSWVTHSVDGNQSDKPRISMSFNTAISMDKANDELASMNGMPTTKDMAPPEPPKPIDK